MQGNDREWIWRSLTWLSMDRFLSLCNTKNSDVVGQRNLTSSNVDG